MKKRIGVALGLLALVVFSMASAQAPPAEVLPPAPAPAPAQPTAPPDNPFPPPASYAPAAPCPPAADPPPPRRKLFDGRLRERIKALFHCCCP